MLIDHDNNKIFLYTFDLVKLMVNTYFNQMVSSAVLMSWSIDNDDVKLNGTLEVVSTSRDHQEKGESVRLSPAVIPF